MTAIIVLGALLGLALLQLRSLAFPPAPDLIGEIEDWRRGRELATQRAEGGPAPVSPMGRITRWVTETVDNYWPEFFKSLAPDLAITQRDLHTWLSKVVGLTLTFGLGPTILMLGRWTRDHEVSVQWGPIIGLLLGTAAVVLSVRDLRSEAARVRGQFTWGLSVYLDMVAMSMEAGQGHAQALPAAAQMGADRAAGRGNLSETRVFGEIRSTIELAPSKGISAWAALGQLGERYGIRELKGLRSSIELANNEGSRVKNSLISRAETMRKERLAGALERANNATESMRQLTMVAAILAAVYIAAPYILSLRTAAGVPG